MLGQKVTPLERVGVYVPGGKAVYPSSVLMNIVPAKVAGVDQIVMTTPPGKDGKVNPSTLVAAKEAGADFVKTSTGFSKAGATFADIELFAANIGPNVKMKAAGGISSMADAEKFLELGADRLGTSRIIKLVKNQEASGY